MHDETRPGVELSSGRNECSGAIETFTLPTGSENVDLRIEPGSLFAHRVGTTLASAGFIAVLVGGGLALFADDFNDEDGVRKAGYITMASGAAGLAIGIPLALLTRTKVTSGGVKIANGLNVTARGLEF